MIYSTQMKPSPKYLYFYYFLTKLIGKISHDAKWEALTFVLLRGVNLHNHIIFVLSCVPQTLSIIYFA